MIHIKKNKLYTLLLASLVMLSFSSCSDGDGGSTGGGCTKCIDNKPAATPFSTTLNGINHSMPLAQAMTMINNYEAVRETMLAEAYPSPSTLPVYETFNLKAIDSLICQKNAIGFRIYMAMDAQNQVRFVLVGVDGDGKDIIQRTKENPGRMLAEYGADVSVLVEEAGQRWP
jgi:hypothetical protein